MRPEVVLSCVEDEEQDSEKVGVHSTTQKLSTFYLSQAFQRNEW